MSIFLLGHLSLRQQPGLALSTSSRRRLQQKPVPRLQQPPVLEGELQEPEMSHPSGRETRQRAELCARGLWRARLQMTLVPQRDESRSRKSFLANCYQLVRFPFHVQYQFSWPREIAPLP